MKILPTHELNRLSRRQFLLSIAAASMLTGHSLGAESTSPLLTLKKIPGSDETIPAIGMGTWLTFDVPDSGNARDARVKVLEKFFELGGGMIDSSPMYGHAEAVIGYCLSRIDTHTRLFAASKIWTPLANAGVSQMSSTENLWGVKPIDLMHVHNLLAWKKHLPRLRQWKDEGRIRHIGVSTSHGRRHKEMEDFLKNEPVDFIQLTYNIEQTSVEDRLLPLAQDLGIGVIVNRPFQRGALFNRYGNLPLPQLAKELGCDNWAQYLLLFVISHPAVTCAIPATTQVEHMTENMKTMEIPLPDMTTRREMQTTLGLD